jgi:hypothetical protein
VRDEQQNTFFSNEIIVSMTLSSQKASTSQQAEAVSDQTAIKLVPGTDFNQECLLCLANHCVAVTNFCSN